MTEWLALATLFLASSQQPAARDTCRRAVTERSPPIRSGTANYYDQGRDSIAALHPHHRLLAERRTGLFGRVEYSLLAYQPDPSALVSISALAVDWEARRTWSIESSCRVDAWAGGLVDTIAALGALSGQTPTSTDAALIEAVRSTVAREFDPQLPPTSLNEWLEGTVGSQDRMHWEVNDCGEQTGNPALDRGRDFPKCVQLRAELEGGRALILLLSAGSQRRQPAASPGYRFGVLTLPRGGQLQIRRLSDLPSAIKAPDAARGAAPRTFTSRTPMVISSASADARPQTNGCTVTRSQPAGRSRRRRSGILCSDHLAEVET
jgi:hypothetical protein